MSNLTMFGSKYRDYSPVSTEYDFEALTIPYLKASNDPLEDRSNINRMTSHLK